MPGFKSDKRLYLNADRSKVVDETDPEAAYLLVGEGGEVSAEDAKKYGLKDESKDNTEADTEAKQEPQPDNKARTMPRDK